MEEKMNERNEFQLLLRKLIQRHRWRVWSWIWGDNLGWMEKYLLLANIPPEDVKRVRDTFVQASNNLDIRLKTNAYLSSCEDEKLADKAGAKTPLKRTTELEKEREEVAKCLDNEWDNLDFSRFTCEPLKRS